MKQLSHKRYRLIGTVAVLSLTTASIFGFGKCGFIHLQTDLGMEQETSSNEDCVFDLSMYPNEDVFVSYQDGTQKVLTYDSKEQLEKGLKELSQNKSVLSFQPNYQYVTAGSAVSDTNFSEQWALHNDGTFSTSHAVSEFPVYSDPFKDPVNDFWKNFMDLFNEYRYGNQYGRQSINQSYSPYGSFTTTTATQGIDINVSDAWSEYDGGTRETIVAIIDTGVDYNHEDLIDSIWVNEGEIPDDGIDNDGNGYVDDVYGWNFYNNNNQVYVGSEDSHGTHGAGTIAATRNNGVGIAGIAGNSKVKLMIIKALGGSEGYGSTESIIKAIQYAQANGAVICNLSFGTSVDDRALKKAIASSDMLFIAAAGNGDDWTGLGTNDDVRAVYPAAYDLDQIISVANLNYTGSLHYSSNYGVTSVDLAAPGAYILSTTPENTYSYMTGTSMAAPMVTGVAAMIYSQYSDVSLYQVKEMILQSTKAVDSLAGKVATGGMLDATAAFEYDYSKIDSVEDEKTKGNAPEILATMGYHRYSGQTVLTITVTDEDNDLVGVYYGSGKLSFSDFSDLSMYESVTLNSSNQAMFQIESRGIYTFYAIDAAGNAATYTVHVHR